MSLYPIGQGLLATALAVIVVAAWLTIGSVFLSTDKEGDAVAPGAAILLGSGVTSFCLALFCAAGMVRTGVIVTGAAALIVLAVRWRHAIKLSRVMLEPWREITVARAPLAVIAVIVWTSAIAPPRSADAMRYHLAHIRQIVSEGRWVSIKDYHYALPFGWSLSYLPFEMLGIPQGAQLLGVALLLVLFGSVLRVLREFGVGRAGMLAAALMLLHPAVLRGFSEASADAYALLVMFVVVALLVRVRARGARDMALIGFASWIGMQSRYQLVAAGIAAAVVIALELRGTGKPLRLLIPYCVGSAGAFVLAWPFYAANYIAFRNPVWPLMINRADSLARFSDGMAHDYSETLRGSYAPLEVLKSLWTLVATPFLFPLAIAILAFIVLALVSRRKEARTIGLFGAIFFVLWFTMAPRLYPRFVLLLLPVAMLSAGLLVDAWMKRSEVVERRFTWVGVIGIVVLAVVSVNVFRDDIRYVATGDLQEYQQYTWFYPVYQWVNRSTPRGSRVLVILSSGQSYYLDRPYRRADPYISGVVDWNTIRTGKQLDELMTRNAYQYLLYEDRDWRDFRGGEIMQTAVSQAIAHGSLVPVRKFNERLYTSRVWRRYTSTPVYVLKNVTSIKKAPP